MKVKQNEIDFIERVVQTAKIINIESIIIEPGFVRALDDARTVVLLETENVPDMSTGSIGLTRTDTFLARFGIAKELDNFSVEAIVEDDEDFVRSFKIKARGISIDYRCANPVNIQAPKNVNDTFLHRVNLNDECINLFAKGLNAMKSDNVVISSNKEVNFILSDVNSDKFKGKIADAAEQLPDNDKDSKFSFTYPAKLLLDMFRKNPTGHFDVGEKGILRFKINNLSIYVLPQIQ